MNRSSSYILLLLVTFCWCLGIVLPAWFSLWGSSANSLSREMYQFYSHICHQFDSRSLHVFGHKLGVCARCTAIYAGFFVGVALVPFVASDRRGKSFGWLFLAAVPMMIDVGLDMTHIHASTMVTRLVTGGVLGVAAALFLTSVIIEACSELTVGRILNRGVNDGPKT